MTNQSDITYDAYTAVAVAIFAAVSYTFLFPCNKLIPLDRRTVAVVGALLCYLTRRFLFPSSQMNVLHAIDFDVLVLLASIMVVNHIVIHLKETKKVIVYLQTLVQENPEHGFWMISLASFVLSPFLTNDGVCLLFVEPILNAFESTTHENSPNDQSNPSKSKLHSSDAVYFLLALACSSNIGSALTYTGNPQNMIVATDSINVMPSYKFLVYMILPTLLAWFATMKWIQRCWKKNQIFYLSSVAAADQQQLSLLHDGREVDLESNNNRFSGNDNNDDSNKNKTIVENNHEDLNISFNNNKIVGDPTTSGGDERKVVPMLKLNIPWCGCSDFDVASPTTAARSPLSPRRRQAKVRENNMKRVVRVVISPFPYMVLILVATMIVMIFVNVMPISGLICVSSMAMVIAVVVGNHWQNQKVWEELETEDDCIDRSNNNNLQKKRHIHRRTSSNFSSVGGRPSKNKIFHDEAIVDIHQDHNRNSSGGGGGDSTISFERKQNVSTKEMMTYHAAPTSEEDVVGVQQQQSTKSDSKSGTGTQRNNLMVDTYDGDKNDYPLTHEEKTDNLNEFFEELFNSIDYSLLLIFMGTFIVVENMASTGIPKFVWDKIVGKVPFKTASSVIGISIFVLVSSQLLGNVAVIQLAKPNIEILNDDARRYAWAVLSYVATVGGNLTITGSAANIIVVEKAARLDANMSIDFFRHFQVCFWITLLCCAAGGAIVSLIVSADNMNGSGCVCVLVAAGVSAVWLSRRASELLMMMSGSSCFIVVLKSPSSSTAAIKMIIVSNSS